MSLAFSAVAFVPDVAGILTVVGFLLLIASLLLLSSPASLPPVGQPYLGPIQSK